MFVQIVFGIPVVLDVLCKLEKFIQNVTGKKLLFRVFFFSLQQGLRSLPYSATLAVSDGDDVTTSGVNGGEHQMNLSRVLFGLLV